MEKNHILDEIKRTTKENGGSPLGAKRFSQETGIQTSDWHGIHWARWGDALVEAGFEPNKMQGAYSDDFIIEKLIELVRELKKFPVVAELKLKSKQDDSFPTRNVFWRLGSKAKLAQMVIEYCERNDGFDDVIQICKPIAVQVKSSSDTSDKNAITGYVYMIQHGTRQEYKVGRTKNPIRREGEIGTELPERIKPIHYIGTDDPAGIESYWHNRFGNKRKNGEWFELSRDDVRAFKRRKYM